VFLGNEGDHVRYVPAAQCWERDDQHAPWDTSEEQQSRGVSFALRTLAMPGRSSKAQTATRGGGVMSVILVNPFEIDPRNADGFMRSWQEAADYIRRQPGFIGTRLHRALASSARFQFVNVAEWESPQHFMSAVQSPEFKRLAEDSPPNFPALYQIVSSEGDDGESGDPRPRVTEISLKGDLQ
jgi:heme-degrading monooxygenase HmoA